MSHSPIHTALFCSFSTSKRCSVNHSLWRTPREQLCIFPEELLASKRARPMNDQTSLRVLQTNQVSRNYNVMLILSPASSLPSQFSCYVFDVMLFWKFCSCSLVFLCCLVAFISAHCISPQFHSCPCAVLLLMVTALMLPRVRNLKHFIKNISWGTYDNNCCDN